MDKTDEARQGRVYMGGEWTRGGELGLELNGRWAEDREMDGLGGLFGEEWRGSGQLSWRRAVKEWSGQRGMRHRRFPNCFGSLWARSRRSGFWLNKLEVALKSCYWIYELAVVQHSRFCSYRGLMLPDCKCTLEPVEGLRARLLEVENLLFG
ncbi:unnamed protein product [Calypogeia fissa]